MSVDAWSLVWQVVVAGTCVAFFTLSALVARGAVRDMLEMFRELSGSDDEAQERRR